MARPPIVISNGGVAGALTQNLVPAADQGTASAVDIIMANVVALNQQTGRTAPVAKTLSGSNKKSDPRIYWRLEGDTASNKELGIEAQ